MPTYRESGVVLRTHKLGEADRIVTILTRGRGRVRTVARGVRKTSSKFGARLEPLSYVDIQCFEGRNLDTVTQVESIEAFGAQLSGDYPRWTAGQAMVEGADQLVGEDGEPEVQQVILLISALRSLAKNEHPSGLILDAYLLRALGIGGWAPSLVNCAACGAPGPHSVFNATAGGVLCSECQQSGSTVPAEGAIELLRALTIGDWDVAESSGPRQRRDGASLVGSYLQWHVERGLRSLRHVDRGL